MVIDFRVQLKTSPGLESGVRKLLSRVLSVRNYRRSVYGLAPLPTDLRFEKQSLANFVILSMSGVVSLRRL